MGSEISVMQVLAASHAIELGVPRCIGFLAVPLLIIVVPNILHYAVFG